MSVTGEMARIAAALAHAGRSAEQITEFIDAGGTLGEAKIIAAGFDRIAADIETACLARPDLRGVVSAEGYLRAGFTTTTANADLLQRLADQQPLDPHLPAATGRPTGLVAQAHARTSSAVGTVRRGRAE